MKNVIRNVAVPTLFAFALFTTSAWAQQAATAPASSSSSSMPAAKTHAQKRMDNVEQRIADQHAELKITDAQSTPWNAYAQVIRDNAQKTGQAFRDRADKLSTMNADDSMKSYAALAQEHADGMKNLSNAWSALYAVLSPEQKETADAMYRNQRPKPHSMPHKQHKASAPASAASAAMPSGG